MPTASLQRGKIPTTTNKCSDYDTIQSNGEVPMMLELWGMRSTPLHCHHSWPMVEAPDRGRSMGQIELDCVPMLNWIAWNRTLTFKLCTSFKLRTYAKLNSSKWNRFCMLNWIVLNRTVWLNWIAWNRNVFDK